MEREVIEAQLVVPTQLSFKRIQTYEKYPKGQSRHRHWKHLKQILQAENFQNFLPDEPNYVNIESPPSMHPCKRICDTTGFEAPYSDPRTNLRYANADVFKLIRSLPNEYVQRDKVCEAHTTNVWAPHALFLQDAQQGVEQGLQETAGIKEGELRVKMDEDRTVHPDCINASNPYHECVEYCFIKIAEAMARRMDEKESDVAQALGGSGQSDSGVRANAPHDDRPDPEEHADSESDQPVEENMVQDFTNLTGKQKKLFELRLKMNEARKANQTAMIAEKKRMEAPSESRGISKQKWLEQRTKKIGKLLDANGLDMKKAYMLDTQEVAEGKYKKREKDHAPTGWDVFNQKSLYKAYKKRTKNIDVDVEEYNKMKETDPEFYREASSLQYGKAPKISEDNIDRMVKELKDRDEKRQSFSRRRKFHEEKDVDSINDRNEHFNKKIERAFGRYTLEIKNNLERGTALPD